jgi:hypothetical protein
MSEPFRLRDDDCWKCIAEELSRTHPDLVEQLREATHRDRLLSALAMVKTMQRLPLALAARNCRNQLKCR